jgi:hypothetical protein
MWGFADLLMVKVVRKYFVAFCALSFALILSSCHVNYSMSGASIAPDVKTVAVKYFTKTASLGPASMSQNFTEKLKDKFLSQTSLAVVDKNADLTFEGIISGYSVAPIAIQTNEVAAQNRLTITVNVKFTNVKDEKQNFETSFSRYSDYSSSQNLTAVEETLIADIYTQIVDDIFNKAVINW